MRREFDGFYVLYTAAALKVAEGKKVKRLVMASILADSIARAQWAIGQKGIDVANLNVRRDAETTMPGDWPGIACTADVNQSV
ncbi:hypothetical protein [Pseudomonas sp. Irchel 3E19]|uniref:hypothetical protein n=1 Tax=Pseudomonas sp. Irchel 3E19 TaxID=2008981 RepID=UPI000BA310D1|nr:hypothetical protein [Pseudomonas sp. Irchel 3E19]